MKLDRMTILVLGALASSLGCAARAPTAPSTSMTPVVGTAYVTQAALEGGGGREETVPRIGKPRISRDRTDHTDLTSKDESGRRGEHRRGGGFSGYK